jgi:hypothetical protein
MPRTPAAGLGLASLAHASGDRPTASPALLTSLQDEEADLSAVEGTDIERRSPE